MILSIAHCLFLLMIAVAIGCSLYRLWKGPSVADRVNAADVVALSCVGLALGHGWKMGDALWLDVAMVAGLVLFVGTTAVALFISPDELSESDTDTEERAS